jgi:hypothetical protein
VFGPNRISFRLAIRNGSSHRKIEVSSTFVCKESWFDYESAGHAFTKMKVVLQVVESDSNDLSYHWKARKTRYASSNSYAINKAGSPATPGKQYHKLYIYRDTINSRDGPNRREADNSWDACKRRDTSNITSNSNEASNRRIPATAGTTTIVGMQAISGHQQ